MPIQILPPQLANQIAAGEVVERPASVIKELLENSLDAGATRIEIDIEAGGSQLIRIRDNGTGIIKDELGLALSRHATSKVCSLQDLEAITSLGFRGEALASISSVSRLTLTSRTAEQAEAWQAEAEGRDMAVSLKPAAHPVGTTIEVADLFFNTPARRRFLRTDKTEFTHIEEVIKRIVLSRSDVSIKLTNNGKLYKHYRAAQDDRAQAQRISAVCGPSFVENTIKLDIDYDIVSISGWLGEPKIARPQRDVQYCYVNGRMMRDKLINHAIRQAYESRITNEQHAAYVLFITVDPKQVDVNVHPSKHEVRFHQSRLIHDFIYQAVHAALNNELVDNAVADAYDPQFKPIESPVKSSELYAGQITETQFERERQASPTEKIRTDQHDIEFSSSNQVGSSRDKHYAPPVYDKKSAQGVAEQLGNYTELMQPVTDVFDTKNDKNTSTFDKQKVSVNTFSDDSAVRVLSLVGEQHILILIADRLYNLPARVLLKAILLAKLHYVKNNESAVSQPLLLPVAIKTDEDLLCCWNNARDLLSQLQFEIQKPRHDTLVIQKVPAVLRNLNLAKVVSDWLMFMPATPINELAALNELVNIIANEYAAPTQSDINTWVQEFENLSDQSFAEFVQTNGHLVHYQFEPTT
ncbi:DNA mismatch repair endonuclease MutL [Algibacillus agarilyticus]|uniref:DNA mismatch repair endonuclease MutL n=1 Tax=Algibacillus agarilyticus TaxID=2234133 RepID=UPI000DCFF242|nr:DNA mismatch repair endonuclease MutL [Algibacillus agarilyticus]